jgi:hypothetical protein
VVEVEVEVEVGVEEAEVEVEAAIWQVAEDMLPSSVLVMLLVSANPLRNYRIYSIKPLSVSV